VPFARQGDEATTTTTTVDACDGWGRDWTNWAINRRGERGWEARRETRRSLS
jgi:hypothetical protein